MKIRPDTRCPVCQAELSNSFHRHLNGFWGGVSAADCPSCNTALEYEATLKAKLKRAGILTRLGVAGLVVTVLFRVIGNAPDLAFNSMIGLSFVLLIVGILMSATKPEQIKVVVVATTD